MRPITPRFCKVVVVIGVGVGTGVTVTDGVVPGVPEGPGMVSCADRLAAVASRIEKMMARRIIDGLNTKR